MSIDKATPSEWDAVSKPKHYNQGSIEAIDYIKDNSSWDCSPHAGHVDEWYDAGSGRTYKIVPCDDCGRY